MLRVTPLAQAAPRFMATILASRNDAPLMTGQEYLRSETLAGWWTDLDTLVRDEIKKHSGGAAAYLSEKNPLWRFVGRVTPRD